MKKQLLASLAISTLILSQSGSVFADETATESCTNPVVATSSTTSPSSVELTENTTAEAPSSLAEETTNPVDGSNSPDATDTAQAADSTQPSSEEETSENATPPSSTTEAPESETPASNDAPPAAEQEQTTEESQTYTPTSTTEPTATTETDQQTTTTNPNISAQTALDTGASQVGTTSTITNQVVSDVSPSAPVYTDTGYKIVSTQNSQLVIEGADGTTQTVSAETVQGTVNDDQTISVTDQTGSLTTLPHTGEKESKLLTSIGLALFTGLFGFWIQKRRQATKKG